jgi:hypothetical protein
MRDGGWGMRDEGLRDEGLAFILHPSAFILFCGWTSHYRQSMISFRDVMGVRI